MNAPLDLAEECLEFIDTVCMIQDSTEAYEWYEQLSERAKELRMAEILRDPAVEDWDGEQESTTHTQVGR